MSYFFLFLVAFDPQVPLLPSGVGFTLLVSLVLLPFVLLRLNLQASSTAIFIKECFPLFAIFLVSFVFILIRILVNEGRNIEFILSWAKAFFVFTSCLFVFLLFFSKKKSSFFIGSLAIVYLSNAVINYVSGSYPQLFGFLELFRGEVISDSLGKNPYRNSFLSGSGYYSIGTAYGLIVLLFSFYLVHTKSKNFLLAAAISFSAIAGFVAARTAFFAIAPALFYIFKSRFLYFVFFVFSGIVSLYFLLELPALQPYKAWMLSFFSLSNDGSGSYLIEEMYFWPGEAIFLFGMGAVNNGSFTYTDAGYMQDILFGGISFLAIKLSFLMILVFRFYRSYPLFVSLVSVALLVFHFKGAFFYNNAQGMAAFYFLYLYLYKFGLEHSVDNMECK